MAATFFICFSKVVKVCLVIVVGSGKLFTELFEILPY